MVDAVRSLPDRLRIVIVGYFFEERSMQDLADELGVSESRISQMRAEALLLLRDGINSQLDPDKVAADARPDGRIARRRAAYHAAIAASSSYRARVDARPRIDGAVPHAG
jgi:RNA polymerase sigma factor for flagellar operon FliA